MTDSPKVIKKFGVFPFLSIAVAILGVVTPIIWSYYTSRAAIEVRLESSVSLLKDDPLLSSDLQIAYKGRPLAGLTRMDFLILNKGTTPIIQSDIFQPPTIILDESSKIITAMITSREPRNLDAELTIDATTNTVQITPKLMNANDHIRVAVYLHSLPSSPPVAAARIKGIKAVEFADARPEQNPVSKHVSWTVYPIGVFSSLFALILPVSIKETRMQYRLRRRLRSEPGFLDAMDSDEYERFVSNEFDFTTSEERNRIHNAIRSLGADPNAESRAKLVASLRNVITKLGASEFLAYLSAITLLAGASYIAWQIW